jgi:protein-S-isoprenylcysteine O-methyltransferase Ste14
MIKPAKNQNQSTGVLLLLFAIVVIGTVMPSTMGSWQVPRWFGGIVSLTAMLGALVVLWRQRAMKGRYVLAFVGTLAFAAVVGWYLSEHT